MFVNILRHYYDSAFFILLWYDKGELKVKIEGIKLEKIVYKGLENEYGIIAKDINLIRDMIGTVYLVRTKEDKFVLKLYRETHDVDIETISNIMGYLAEQNCPVPKLIKTKTGHSISNIHNRKGMLMTYITGDKCDPNRDHQKIIATYNIIQQTVKTYHQTIPIHNERFYLDRFLNILKQSNYHHKKIDILRKIGYHLFNSLSVLPKGFTQGDYHSGNMIISNEKLYIVDFDACGQVYQLLDLSVAFEQTNFNVFKEEDMIASLTILRDIDFIKDDYLQPLLAFSAIRHYEIIATILETKGYDQSDHAFFDEQYEWIKHYYLAWCKMFDEESILS